MKIMGTSNGASGVNVSKTLLQTDFQGWRFGVVRILRCRSDSGCAVEALRWISYLASFNSMVGLVAFCQSYFFG